MDLDSSTPTGRYKLVDCTLDDKGSKKKLFYPYFSITSLVSDYFISISQVILLKLKQKNKILIRLICILLLFNTFFLGVHYMATNIYLSGSNTHSFVFVD